MCTLNDITLTQLRVHYWNTLRLNIVFNNVTTNNFTQSNWKMMPWNKLIILL